MSSKKRKTKKKKRSRAVSPEEAAFLAEYDVEAFHRPSVTVDIVIFTILDADLKVLLIQRDAHPFKGTWALPGGFVRVGPSASDQGEDLEEAAERRLMEETRLPRGAVYLEQLGAFGKAGRDPRTRVITVAYYALVRPDLAPFASAGEGAAAAEWISVSDLSKRGLAFDHAQIIAAALERMRASIEDTNMAFELVPETFSIPELRAVFEVIKGTAYDPGNFRRRFNRMLTDGVISKAAGKRITRSKPAQVFKFKRS